MEILTGAAEHYKGPVECSADLSGLVYSETERRTPIETENVGI